MVASVAAPSCRLAGFCRRLSCRAWLLPSCRYGFSRFGRASNRDWQFQLGLFCSAMVTMVQWLDARSLFFHTLLIMLYFSGARPQDMPESFSLSWPESGRTIPLQAVHFSSMSPVEAVHRWQVRLGSPGDTFRFEE